MRKQLFEDILLQENDESSIFFIGIEFIDDKQSGSESEVSFFYNTILKDYRGDQIEGIEYSSQKIRNLIDYHLEDFIAIYPLEEFDLPTLEKFRQRYGDFPSFPRENMLYLNKNGAHVLIYRNGCKYKVAWWEGLENL